jgi:hypothetical protein
VEESSDFSEAAAGRLEILGQYHREPETLPKILV